METTPNAESRILEAATEVFCNRGFDGARMQEIADSAGISKASLHYYFRSKDRLFRQAVQQLFTLIIRNVVSRISDNCSLEELVQQLVSGYFEMFLLYRKQALFFFTEMMKHEALLDEILQGIDRSAIVKGIAGRFKAEREAGTIVDIEPFDLLVNIISLCVYPIMAEPLLKRVFGMSDKDFGDMLERRTQSITSFVLRSIMQEQK